jgi:small subunit ribosomal protein S16
MVTIRMARKGAKRRPFYNIVVTEHSNPRDGSFIERVGFFNPVATGNEEAVRLDMDRVQHWLDKGAKASESVDRLIRKQAKAAS